MFRNISIIGDGAMGTVLGTLLCEKSSSVGITARIWGYDRRQLEEIQKACENRIFLPGYKIPKTLEFISSDEEIMKDADLIISAVPCQYIRQIWQRLKPYTPVNCPVVSVAKGIENDTLLRPSEVIAQVLGDGHEYVVLSGPTIADELMRKLPATACAASSNDELAREVQHILSTPSFRVYTNTDIVGVELAGAMKNVIAIAAGIVDGIGAGDNAKAALLCRGLAEITRLGEAMGARLMTFSGLAGLGDLVTTCISPTGRNRSFGERIGKGLPIDEAKRATQSVIEGIATCESVIALAEKFDVEMPITQAVYQIIYEAKSVKEAISELMTRELKSE